jgi:hypothetical protein
MFSTRRTKNKSSITDHVQPALRVPLPIDPVGLGDIVHKVTSTFGVPHCAPCAARKEALNKAFGFGRRVAR